MILNCKNENINENFVNVYGRRVKYFSIKETNVHYTSITIICNALSFGSLSWP